MEFGWTPEQTDLYERALRFSKAALGERKAEGEEAFRDRWRALAEFGVLGLSVPERFGGLGLDALTTSRVAEALGRGAADMGLVFSSMAHLFACVMPLLEAGDEGQRERLIPKLCSGEWIGANAITEAEAGSDVFALRTTAVRDGDAYVLNGVKTYVTNAPYADLFLVYAVTTPKAGFLGLSAFTVRRDTPGVRVGQPFEKMGLTSSPIGMLYLEDCRIPESARIGLQGRGATIFRNSMKWERACLFGAYVGQMEQALERTIEHAKQRTQFGRPLGKNQAISHRIADMKLRLEMARLLLYRACWEMDRGSDALLEVALAKLAISEHAVQSAMDALQIHGGGGYMTETGIERLLRDALPSRIFSGTSEMQRDIIASRLGL